MNHNDLKFENTLYIVPNKVKVGQEGIRLEWPIEKGTGDMIEEVKAGCFDAYTEVLTNEGWKLWPDVTGNELFLSSDPETGTSMWVKAEELVSYHYKGDMECFKGRAFSLVTTPDHKHFIRSGYTSGNTKRLATSGAFTENTVFINTAENGWVGKSPNGKQIAEHTLPFSDYCVLMGWYLSEGSCFDKKERENLSVFSIRQSAGKHLSEVTCVVEKAFGKKTHGTDRAELYISRDTGKFFQAFGNSGVKYIPEDIRNASIHDIRLFLNAYLKGDGHERIQKTQNYGVSHRREFYTSSKKMADDLMELIIKVGDRPSLTVREPRTQTHKNGTYKQNGDQYVVSWLKSKTTSFKVCEKSMIPYDGFVYDVSLEHNHTLFVRRDGKVTISGNCGCTAEVQVFKDRVVATYNDNTKESEVTSMPGKVKTISKNLRVYLKDGLPLKVKNERGVEAYNAQKTAVTLFFHVNVFV